MTIDIMQDTEDALVYYSKIGDTARVSILKAGLIYYVSNYIGK